MINRDPEWYVKEYNVLLDEWYENEDVLDFPEYLEIHFSDRAKKYWHKKGEYRKKMREKLICVD